MTEKWLLSQICQLDLGLSEQWFRIGLYQSAIINWGSEFKDEQFLGHCILNFIMYKVRLAIQEIGQYQGYQN